MAGSCCVCVSSRRISAPFINFTSSRRKGGSTYIIIVNISMNNGAPEANKATILPTTNSFPNASIVGEETNDLESQTRDDESSVHERSRQQLPPPSQEEKSTTPKSTNATNSSPIVAEEGEGGDPRTRTTNVFSRLLMLWTFPAIKAGYNHSLTKDDVPFLTPSLKSKGLFERAKEAWLTERDTYPRERRSMMRMIWRIHRNQAILGICLEIIQGILFSVGRPLLLRELILISASTQNPVDSIGWIFGYCAVVFVEGVR